MGDTMGTASYGAPAIAAVLAAFALTALGPAAAEAQNRVGFEGRAGLGLPAFDLADRAGAGTAVGLDLTYALGERVALVAGGDVEFLPGEELEGSDLAFQDLTVWHYALGLEAQLLDPVTTYWRLSTAAGVGASTYDADGGESRTTPALFGSLELGYEVSPEADLFLGVKSWMGLGGEDETLVVQDPLDLDVFPPSDPLFGVESVAWTFPVTAGIRFHF